MTIPPTSRPEWRLSAPRIWALITASAFCGILSYVYLTWLAPNWGYFGFTLNNEGFPALILSLPLVLLTAATLPLYIRRFSDYFLWMLFYFAYAPFMVIAPFQDLRTNVFAMVALTALGFETMRRLARISIRRPRLNIKVNDFAIFFFLFYIGSLIYVLAVFGSRLRLVGLEELYDQRRIGGEAEASSLVGYASGLLSGALNPFMIALGIVGRRKQWVIIGALGQVLIYATVASKGVLLSIILLPFFYYGLMRQGRIQCGRLGFLAVASCLVPLALLGDPPEILGEDWRSQVVSLIFFRTYGTVGAMPGIYADFFATNPLTYYSHINLVSLFVSYPYQLSVGEIVGLALNLEGLDANASFLATDGIAAVGIGGIPIICAIIGLFLAAADSFTGLGDQRLPFLASIPFIMSVCNASFFQSLLTGGGILLVLLVYLWQEAGRTTAEDTAPMRPGDYPGQQINPNRN